MRALLAPIGSRGDVAPLVALGAALRRAGHDASACVTRDLAHLFEDVGIATVAIDADAGAFAQDVGGRLRDVIDIGKRLRPAAAAAQAALDEAYQNPDVVVGSGLQLLAPALCEARGARYVYASTSPSLERSAKIPPHFAPFHGLGPIANRVLWGVQDFALTKLFMPILAEYRSRLGLGPSTRNLWDTITAPESMLSVYDAEIVGDTFGAGALGACIGGSPPMPLPGHLEAFLGRGAPPIMVTVGSVAGPDSGKRVAGVVAAARAAGQRVVLDGAFADHGGIVDADNVCWISGVDYRSLFPRLAVVVHHGGAGTLAVAARAGVPQVIVPHVFDQFFWARRVAVVGIGSRGVPAKKLSQRRVGRAISEATAAPVIAQAQTMAAALADVDGPARAAETLEGFVTASGSRRNL